MMMNTCMAQKITIT